MKTSGSQVILPIYQHCTTFKPFEFESSIFYSELPEYIEINRISAVLAKKYLCKVRPVLM
jgi:hypothetical protein